MQAYELLRLRAACALNKDSFCLAFSEAEYDDMYSYILVYEGRYPQPWSRYDVQRILDSMTGRFDDAGLPIFYAKSDEGDVYTITPGQGTSHEKIPGAGVYSDDATINAYTNQIVLVGGKLLVTGHKSQLYERVEGDWEWFNKLKLPQLPESYEYLIFGDIDGTSVDDLYLLVSMSPTNANRELTEEEEADAAKLFELGEDEKANAIFKAAEGPSRVIEGRLYHWNGTEWRVVATPRSGKYNPEPATLADLYVESENRIWAVGHNGVILSGNAEDGFEDLSFAGDRDELVSITKFRERMVIASSYGLHWFDGHILTPLKPKLDPSINRSVPTPLKVQAVDDVLFYFDYKHGVHRFDGENWEEIVIPPELLERDFKGLPPRK
jgi:hypothetical protein